jgi:D-threo-aldose 1-dehydrogenase
VLTHNRYTLVEPRRRSHCFNWQHSEEWQILNAAPYGGGILSRGPKNFPRYAYRNADDVILERARQMKAICDEYKVPLAAAALQFSMHDPRITSTVVGMTRPERIAQTLDLARHPIPEEVWKRLEAVGSEMKDL